MQKANRLVGARAQIWIKVVAHCGGSCGRRVVGVRACRFLLSSAHLFRTFSLVTRSRNQLAHRRPFHFSSATLPFALRYLCSNSITGWPIDPTRLIASAPALLLFPHAHPAHIRDRCRISNVGGLRRQTTTTLRLPLTLARTPRCYRASTPTVWFVA